jgi:hypothetical protein
VSPKGVSRIFRKIEAKKDKIGKGEAINLRIVDILLGFTHYGLLNPGPRSVLYRFYLSEYP